MVARNFVNSLQSVDYLNTATATPTDTTPAVSPFPTLYDSSLDAALGNTRLALLVRQVHYFLGKAGGVERDGHHWIFKTFSQWYETFPWGHAWQVQEVCRCPAGCESGARSWRPGHSQAVTEGDGLPARLPAAQVDDRGPGDTTTGLVPRGDPRGRSRHSRYVR